MKTKLLICGILILLLAPFGARAAIVTKTSGDMTLKIDCPDTVSSGEEFIVKMWMDDTSPAAGNNQQCPSLYAGGVKFDLMVNGELDYYSGRGYAFPDDLWFECSSAGCSYHNTQEGEDRNVCGTRIRTRAQTFTYDYDKSSAGNLTSFWDGLYDDAGQDFTPENNSFILTYIVHDYRLGAHNAGFDSTITASCTVNIASAQQPDFFISKILPVQVVPEPDINGDSVTDLVADKSTAIMVQIGMDNYEGLDDETELEAEIMLDGHYYTGKKKIKDLIVTDPGNNPYPNITVYLTRLPKTLGDQVIEVELTYLGSVPESDTDNNVGFEDITVKDTDGLDLVYVPVVSHADGDYGPSGPLKMEKYHDSAMHSSEYVKAIFPIAGSELDSNEDEQPFTGNPTKCHLLGCPGVFDDIENIWYRAKRISDSEAEKAIGIVTEDYFTYHNSPGTVGISYGWWIFNWDAVIATEGYWTVPAHEIGHTYGLENEILDSAAVVGIWVDKKEVYIDGYCFMTTGEPGRYTYKAANNVNMWIENKDYEHLFEKFKAKGEDPDVLLVTGRVHKDGTTELGDLYLIKNGTVYLEDIIPGNYSLRLLNTHGDVLSEIDFHMKFEMYFYPQGWVESDMTGFAFAIPYPDATSRIQVLDGTETLAEFNPNSKLLSDAVDLIPDHGFVKNPEQRRKALHNKIRVIEENLETKDTPAAKNKLEKDVKDKVEKWLVDGYEVDDPLQLTKDEVLELVDEIILRLEK